MNVFCGEYELNRFCEQRACKDAKKKADYFCLKFLKIEKMEGGLFLNIESLKTPFIEEKSTKVELDDSDDEGDYSGLCKLGFKCVDLRNDSELLNSLYSILGKKMKL